MSKEQWRPVVGYEGLYEVSDLGRIWCVRRKGSAGGLRKLYPSKSIGYWCVGLTRDGIGTTRTVHSLVMEAFVGPRPEGHEVRHLDGDRLNARLSNLVYSTHHENIRDKRTHGTDHNTIKTHCPRNHPYDEENTYILPSRPTARYCRACQRLHSRGQVRVRRRSGAS